MFVLYFKTSRCYYLKFVLHFILGLFNTSGYSTIVEVTWSNTDPERTVDAKKDASNDLQKCADSERSFRTNRGLNQHLRSCHLEKVTTEAETPKGATATTATITITTTTTTTTKEISTIQTNSKESDATSSLWYKWGKHQDFERNLSLAYEKILYWKRTYFCHHQDRQENGSFMRFQG